jgi:uncharacterized protein (UPF0276 family)
MISSHGDTPNIFPLIGVGLRHAHYDDALSAPATVDFIEVHAENFFAEGGASFDLMNDIAKQYKVSLHATSLGLGSAVGVPLNQIEQLKKLVDRTQPILLSDHACFSWADVNNNAVHAGDLLPIPFNDESLQVMASNVIKAQDVVGRTILVENLSAYMALPGSTYSESEFLVKLCELTDCRLLLDLNNLVVNANNHALMFNKHSTANSTESTIDVYEYATSFLSNIPTNIVGEFHLAGCTEVNEDELMIDDHSKPVADVTWRIYEYAIHRFGAVPTLIEWDEELPSWPRLIAEANKAREIATRVITSGEF